MSDRVTSLVQLAIALGKAESGTIIPLGDTEIHAVEADMGTALPAAYAQFLRKAGGGLGLVDMGGDMFHPAILGLRNDVQDLLDLNHVGYRLKDG